MNWNLKTVFEYMKSDVYRYYGKATIFTLLKGFRSKTIRFQYFLRLSNGKGLIALLGRIFLYLSRNENLVISWRTQIGYGLYIGHNGPVIINPSAVIGNNCNLSQFTTIGSNKGKAATIGDTVYIGPNVCIVEDVHIGDNATIGAGSVVTKDIPENATAAGNYAKVLNYNNPGRFIKNRWQVQSKV